MSDAAVFGPKELAAYEILATELSAKQDWRGLERATRLAIHAAGRTNPEAAADLWRRLRALLQDRLSDPKRALLAAQHLARLDPTHVDDQLALARLYVALGNLAEAGTVHERLVAHHPTNTTVVRELIASRLRQNLPDGAWTAMSVLAFAGALTEGERAFYEARKPARLPLRRIDWRDWGSIAPPGADADLDAVFASLATAIFEAAKEERFPPDQADRRFVPSALAAPLFPAAFVCALEALGLPAQPHFAQPDLAHAQQLGPVLDDSLRELLFIAGRQAAYHRPWHLVLYGYHSIPQLTAFFWAGRLMARPETSVPSALSAFVTGLALDLERSISSPARYSLGVAFRRLEQAGTIKIKEWRDAQDLSAARFGLLLCGDLQLARKVLDGEPRPPDALSPEQVMKDLCAFAASGMYAVYREKLGLGADVDVVLH